MERQVMRHCSEGRRREGEAEGGGQLMRMTVFDSIVLDITVYLWIHPIVTGKLYTQVGMQS